MLKSLKINLTVVLPDMFETDPTLHCDKQFP